MEHRWIQARASGFGGQQDQDIYLLCAGLATAQNPASVYPSPQSPGLFHEAGACELTCFQPARAEGLF